MSNLEKSTQGSNELQKNDGSRERDAQYALALLAVSKNIGIRNPPDVSTINSIRDFVYKYYKHFTPADINEAFMHAMAQGIEHYGSMDMQLVAKCLNSYRHIVDARVKSAEQKTTQKLLDRAPEINEREAYQYLVQYMNENGEPPIIYCWHKAYHGMLGSLPTATAREAIKSEVDSMVDGCVARIQAEIKEQEKGRDVAVIMNFVSAVSVNDGRALAEKEVLLNFITNQTK